MFNLDKLSQQMQICDPATGKPTVTFIRYWNAVIDKLTSTIGTIIDVQDNIELALQQAGIAVLTAQQTAANEALKASYTSPGAILTSAVSTTDPTKATITIAAHSRVYPQADGSEISVAVEAGTLDVVDLATTYYVFYIDADREGGAVVYSVTEDYLFAGQGGARHAVGSVTTPTVATDPPNYGGGPRPPGTGPYRNHEVEP